MPRKLSFSAVLLTLALHALALAWAMGWVFKPSDSPPPLKTKTTVVYLNLLKPPDPPQREPIQRKPITAPTPKPAPALPPVTTTPAAPVTPPNTPRATMAAPPPPTAEEWAFAAGYTLSLIHI
ncbi:MAG: energy transducer TonB, partial [Limnohabitans sp.]|nr:energy transducer TonB [Limnohabitans sp.]